MVGYRRTPCRSTAFSSRPAARSSPSCASAARPPPPTWPRSSGSRPTRSASSWSCSSATAWSKSAPVRRGPTKPTLEFSLTPEADTLFPQPYDKMLSAVLREVREQFGAPAVEQIFDGIAKRAVEKIKPRITASRCRGQGRPAHADAARSRRRRRIQFDRRRVRAARAHLPVLERRRKSIRKCARSSITSSTKRSAASTSRPSRSQPAARAVHSNLKGIN